MDLRFICWYSIQYTIWPHAAFILWLFLSTIEIQDLTSIIMSNWVRSTWLIKFDQVGEIQISKYNY